MLGKWYTGNTSGNVRQHKPTLLAHLGEISNDDITLK